MTLFCLRSSYDMHPSRSECAALAAVDLVRSRKQRTKGQFLRLMRFKTIVENRGSSIIQKSSLSLV